METKPIAALDEIPITERYGVWARWCPAHDYLYLIDSDPLPTWTSCLGVIWNLPESQTQTLGENHTEPSVRTLEPDRLWA